MSCVTKTKGGALLRVIDGTSFSLKVFAYAELYVIGTLFELMLIWSLRSVRDSSTAGVLILGQNAIYWAVPEQDFGSAILVG